MEDSMQNIKTAFVTGSTGLLGNNLVKELLNRGYKVKVLTRSQKKAELQFHNLPIEIITGDLKEVENFKEHLKNVDILFNTAAYFRDNYKGGNHWNELYETNIKGTQTLIESAISSGIQNIVHTSSIAVLDGPEGSVINETMSRALSNADNYYKSKILSENTVREISLKHPEVKFTYVLPGWMFGPGDLGPTSSGQLIQDYLQKKIPGIPPGTFSVVDARDVAIAHIQAAEVGINGERYLAAGVETNMHTLFELLEKTTHIKSPKIKLPYSLVYFIALLNETYSFITKKPILMSLESVRLLKKEKGKTNFNNEKSQTQLNLIFRSFEQTLLDTIPEIQARLINKETKA